MGRWVLLTPKPIMEKQQKSLLKTENFSATIQTAASLLLQSVSIFWNIKGKRQNA